MYLARPLSAENKAPADRVQLSMLYADISDLAVTPAFSLSQIRADRIDLAVKGGGTS